MIKGKGDNPAHEPLDSTDIYSIVAQEGIDEMARPTPSLIWSGIAAGLLISFSLIFKAVLYAEFHGFSAHHAISSIGYTVGFILVIYARLQLFTENTISPVLPTIAVPSKKRVLSTGRIWVISLLANFIGTAIMALAITHTPLLPAAVVDAVMDISRHVEAISAVDSFFKAIPAGLLIAALVWSRPRAHGSDFALIFIVTYLIAVGSFTHVVVGSGELFALVWMGEASLLKVLVYNTLPTLLGNLAGGTGLFALIAWAQIRDEVREHVEELRKEEL